MAEVTLVIPARCQAGHELLPRTTLVMLARERPGAARQVTGWECARCVRESVWRAQHPNTPIPAERMDEGRFCRSEETLIRRRRMLPAWTRQVIFESGWQFTDPDPTPAMKEAREVARADRERLDAAEAEARYQAERELDDARERAEQRAANRLAAERSTAEIQRMMAAFRAS